MNLEKALIIAEVGSVHDGSIGNAKKLVELFSKKGADVIKFQTHLADFETTKNATSPTYFQDENRYDYFKRIEFSESQWRELVKECHINNVLFSSSVFSIQSLELLLKIGSDMIKIPSGEISNLQLIKEVSRVNLPVHISTGMSSLEEIDKAIEILSHVSDLTIYQCTSLYPCRPNQVGLNVINEFKQRYGRKVGFSDHTQSEIAAVLAINYGISAIEKHVGFSKEMYGSDAQFAMEPNDFEHFALSIREAEIIVGSTIDKNNLELVKHQKLIFEKSLVAQKNLQKGDVISKDDLAVKKPGTGLSPSHIDALIGRTLKRTKEKDEIFSWEDFN
jgi:N-acetylneuraminate synthase